MSPGHRIYADYNATAPLRPEAKGAVLRALEITGNPSSVHGEGRKARALVEGAREAIAGAIGACRDDIAFTSGGTEAVGAPLRGALASEKHLDLVCSMIEHDAVASVEGVMLWPISRDGVADLGFLGETVKMLVEEKGCRPLVSLMLVNNETGVIQPVAEAAEIVHAAGGLIHCDAIQALGKITTSVIDLDVDYLSISAHKIGGPQGVGAFYVKPGAPFCAVQTGGGQEFGRRAGTENVAGIAGFGAAVEAAEAGLADYQALGVARDRMESALKRAAPALQVHGEAAPRVAAVSCFGVEGLPSETQIMGLDLAGFAVSAGSACSSGKVKPSRVLTAMGLSDTAARSAIRASFGWATKPEDFDALANAWIKMAARARPQLVKLDAHV
jgi:cysteine desulfurase